MTPFFIYFFCSNCLQHSFLYLKMVKIYFLNVSFFYLFWSVKHLNFEQKLPIRTSHHIFLISRQPEVTKNPYSVLFPQGSRKTVSANGLAPVCRGAYIHYFKINPPTFCSPLFSKPLGQDIRSFISCCFTSHQDLYQQIPFLQLFRT